jgi:hypothetical protein
MTVTTSATSVECIHSVPTQQCASCRTCSHGLAASRCLRCREATAKKPSPGPQPSEQYEEYEIFFVPAQNSWYYRGPDAEGTVSSESYRSAFQARRAVIAALAAPPQNGSNGVIAGKKKRKK